MLNDADMYKCMKVVKSLKAITQVHAENGDLIAEVSTGLEVTSRTGFRNLGYDEVLEVKSRTGFRGQE